MLGWHNLHLNPESPSKGEIELLPTLDTCASLSELRSLDKKQVISEVVKMKQ